VFVVDTNVLVYAADEDSPHHKRCMERLGLWRQQEAAWYITWSIAYEFLRITTHPRVMHHPWNARQAWRFIMALLDAPGLVVLVQIERHAAVAARVFAEIPHLAGNLAHDAHTAILMREHGIRQIYTRDTDFHRFPFIEPMDPLA
jgi:toxin-antitoxin system PIN domain toxin